MTIKEVEAQTGLPRSNIRFYEKEKLIEPSRNDANGYRDYSEKDVACIRKIAWLRTMDVSIEDIRSIISGKATLTAVIEKQAAALQTRIEEYRSAKIICERMLKDEDVSFDTLQIEKYVSDLETYWEDNRTVFQLDSVGFLHIWGSFLTWAVIASLCLLVGLLSYGKLPAKIPVQWSGGTATSSVDKLFIFIYPLACIMIRFMLRPVLYMRFLTHSLHRELICEYLSNYICFIAFSVELFSILFVWGLAKSVVTVLYIDTAVLIGILIIALVKMRR